MWQEWQNEWLAWVRQNWHNPLAVVLLLLLATIFVFSFFAYIDFSKIPITAYFALGVILPVILAVWIRAQRPPRPPKNTVAFALAIRTENDQHERRIKQDFIETLRELVNQGTLRYRFTVIEVPKFIAERIKTSDDAENYSRKGNWHFMLYGRARLRRLNDKDHHVLNLEGLVRHRKLNEVVSRQLAIEFRELLPRDITLEAENDLLGFEFTAKYMAFVAQYIIGIAAFLSGDFIYSQSLYEKLKATLTAEHAKVPFLQKIIRRLPIRLTEVYGAQATLVSRNWRIDRDLQKFNEMKPFLDRLQALAPSNYSAHLLRSVYHFVSKRDVSAAITELRKCKALDLKDGTWRLNYALLLAYRGELQQAYKQYQVAFRSSLQPEMVIQVEDFMLWVLEEEPDKVQLHYCLGLVNSQGKSDPGRALEEFTAFLEKTNDGDKPYRLARKDARIYVRDLRELLDTERRKD